MKGVLFIFAILAAIAAFLFKDQLPADKVEQVSTLLAPLTATVLPYVSSLSSSFNSLLTPSEVKVNLFKNGFESENVTHIVLLNQTNSFDDLQNEFAKLLYPNTPFAKVEVYNELGDLLSNVNELKNEMELYVSIDGELFMHPGKYVGYTRTVAGMTLITLSLSPRVFLVKSLVSLEQCDEIVAQATSYGELHRSVVYQESGEDVSTTRTSSTAYVNYPVDLLDNAFNLTKLPKDVSYLYPDYQLQVIHYHPNQYFHPHHDGFFIEAVGDEKWFEKAQRNRYLTLFLYLNDVEEGGQTAFISYDEYVAFYAQADKYDVHTNNPCDKATVSKTPSKGDAILFYNLKPGGSKTGEIDWSAVHSGCGVKKGEKWACNVWMYNRPTTVPEYIATMKNVGLMKNDDASVRAATEQPAAVPEKQEPVSAERAE